MADQSLLTQAMDRVQNRFLLTNLLAGRDVLGSVPTPSTSGSDHGASAGAR